MEMTSGVCVLHLFCDGGANQDDGAVRDGIDAAIENGVQVVAARLLGHKAEFCLMLLSGNIDPVFEMQATLRRSGVDIVDSYLSITEVSEYAPELPPQMLQDRLYPQLPPEGKQAFCFYPMSKGREGHANWYNESFERRRDMMYEHGMSGRAFSGKIVQLITASTGLDSHEWGVTLFALDLEVIKDVVYTLRFDEASANYGIFGDFWVGEVIDPKGIFG